MCSIQNCIAAEELSNSTSDAILNTIIANSLFTPKQISIISNLLQKGKKPSNLSGGAYYRQVSQCRNKAIAVLYSVMLLELLGAIDAGSSEGLAKVGRQLHVIFAPDNRDVTSRVRAEDVTSVMRDVIKKMCNL